MIRETLEALQDSIDHWQRMRDDPIGSGDRPFAKSCALCQIFIFAEEVDEHCVGCPVANKTGNPDCEETPYYETVAPFNHVRVLGEKHPLYAKALKAWQEAADAELEFLRSLLPDKKCRNCKSPLADGEDDRCTFCSEAIHDKQRDEAEQDDEWRLTHQEETDREESDRQSYESVPLPPEDEIPF